MAKKAAYEPFVVLVEVARGVRVLWHGPRRDLFAAFHVDQTKFRLIIYFGALFGYFQRRCRNLSCRKQSFVFGAQGYTFPFVADHFASSGCVGPLINWNTINFTDPNYVNLINGSIVVVTSPLSTGYGRMPIVQQPNDPEWGFFWLKRHGVLGIAALASSSNFAGGNEHLVDSWEWCRRLAEGPNPFMVRPSSSRAPFRKVHFAKKTN